MADAASVTGTVKAAEFARSVLSGVSLNVPSIFALAAGSIFMACCPGRYLPWHIEAYRWAFCLAAVVFIVYLAVSEWYAHKPTRAKIWHLNGIGADEREVLSAYLKQDQSCLYFYALHGPVLSLIAKGILLYAGAQVPVFDAPIMIDPYIMRHLRKHPEILRLSKGDIGTEPLSGPLQPWEHIMEE